MPDAGGEDRLRTNESDRAVLVEEYRALLETSDLKRRRDAGDLYGRLVTLARSAPEDRRHTTHMMVGERPMYRLRAGTCCAFYACATPPDPAIYLLGFCRWHDALGTYVPTPANRMANVP